MSKSHETFRFHIRFYLCSNTSFDKSVFESSLNFDLHYFVFLYLGWNPNLGAHPLCLESFKLAYLSTKLLLFCSYSQWMIKGQKAILAWKNFGLWHQFLFMTCLWNCILHFKDMKCFKTWGFMTFHKDYLVNSWLKAFKHYRIIPLASQWLCPKFLGSVLATIFLQRDNIFR